MRRAGREDIDVVLAMHAEASEWLSSKGKDQWQPDAVGKKTKDRVRKSIEKTVTDKTCWLAYINNEVVGTITVDSSADPEFWVEADDPADAVYVHRMIVRREDSGQRIGKVLLALADQLARNAGRHWVRLDAWSTNEQLHKYYERMGFGNFRTLRCSHRGSGALFQRAVPELALNATFRTAESLNW